MFHLYLYLLIKTFSIEFAEIKQWYVKSQNIGTAVWLHLYLSICLRLRIFSFSQHLLFKYLLGLHVRHWLDVLYHIRWFVVTLLSFFFIYFLLNLFVMFQLILLLLHWKIGIYFWKIKKWDAWSTLQICWLSF